MKRENRSYEKVEESDGKIIENDKRERKADRQEKNRGSKIGNGREKVEGNEGNQRQEMEGEKRKEMKGRTVQEKETKSFDGERDWMDIWKHNER